MLLLVEYILSLVVLVAENLTIGFTNGVKELLQIGFLVVFQSLPEITYSMCRGTNCLYCHSTSYLL